jgi:hypothetical protein
LFSQRKSDAPERPHRSKKSEKKRDFWSRAAAGARKAAHISGKTAVRVGAESMRRAPLRILPRRSLRAGIAYRA